MSTQPVAIRFELDLLNEMKEWAKVHSTTVSAAVQLFSAEGLRMRQVPGVVFRDGAAGRRAAVEGGQDIWEIIETVRDSESKDASIQSTAENTGIPERDLRIALDYYTRWPQEVDDQIARNTQAAEDALTRWQQRQAVLS
jgi:hypothetical protein